MHACMFVSDQKNHPKRLQPSTVEGEVNRAPMNVTCSVVKSIIVWYDSSRLTADRYRRGGGYQCHGSFSQWIVL